MEKKVTVHGTAGYRFVKRAFDIVASLLGIIVLAGPMLIMAVIVKLSSSTRLIYPYELRLPFGLRYLMPD